MHITPGLAHGVGNLFGAMDTGTPLVVTAGNHEFVGMDFEPAVDIPANVESHGARGHLVETPDGIAPTIEEALDRPGPDVVDVLVHD